MPSLISQMLNGQTPTTMQPPQQNSQQQLDKSIENTRKLMQQFQMMNNKEQALMQILQNNPQFAQIASMAARNGNLQQVAEQMAQQYGVSADYVIKNLLKK